jgi:OOP family OmpA-OmpF porin
MRAGTLLSCLGFGWAVSAHAADPGWYVLGFAGESSASGLSQNQADENLVAIVESAGLEVVDLSSTLDDSDTGFGLAGGYQINDHFAVEFGYVDLGSVNYRADTTLAQGAEQADADVTLQSSASGPVLSVLGILPVGERFSVFGRAGLSLLNADGTVRVTIDDMIQRASQSSQKSDLVFGVGAELAFAQYYAIRLGWDRYLDVGTEDVTGDIDADVITLGLRIGLAWFR